MPARMGATLTPHCHESESFTWHYASNGKGTSILNPVATEESMSPWPLGPCYRPLPDRAPSHWEAWEGAHQTSFHCLPGILSPRAQRGAASGSLSQPAGAGAAAGTSSGPGWEWGTRVAFRGLPALWCLPRDRYVRGRRT